MRQYGARAGAPLYAGQTFSDEYGVPNGIPVQPGIAPGALPYGPVIPPTGGVAPLLPMPGAPLPLPGGPPKIPAGPGEQPGMVRGGGHRQWNRGAANTPRQVYGAAPALPAFLPGAVPYAMQACRDAAEITSRDAAEITSRDAAEITSRPRGNSSRPARHAGTRCDAVGYDDSRFEPPRHPSRQRHAGKPRLQGRVPSLAGGLERRPRGARHTAVQVAVDRRHVKSGYGAISRQVATL